MKRILAIGLMTAALAVVVSAKAEAVTILNFGQSSAGNLVTGTANGAGTQTTIVATNVPVSITFIENGAPTAAFFTLNATSFGNAILTLGGNVVQEFTATFSITSGLNNTGTNYLSGGFTDGTFGLATGAGLTMTSAEPPLSVSFTSSVITSLGLGRGVSLSFANVTPGVGITGSTMSSFTSSVTGTFSGNVGQVPEPGSMLLLGTGLLGLAAAARRRAARKS